MTGLTNELIVSLSLLPPTMPVAELIDLIMTDRGRFNCIRKMPEVINDDWISDLDYRIIVSNRIKIGLEKDECNREGI